jgi:single-stranded-DNA-specific exonuclease
MQQPWTLRPPVTPSAELIAAVGHPLVAQLLTQRGVDTPAKAIAFLDPNHYTPAAPGALIGLDHAARTIHDAAARRQNILIWGDFDVDGQTSTALLVVALQRLIGEEHVRFHVPNRFTESHGIRLAMLSEKLADPAFTPQVILTCDTGIAEGPAIAQAKDAGLTVVVTDHHDLPAEFKELTPGVDGLWGASAKGVDHDSVRRADAIVNPKFQPVGDPLRTLPGVGVAFKLVQRFYELAGLAGEENELLDLVALGIVADVAEQVHDARYLLQRGLEQLRRTRRAGLLALMDVSRIRPEALTADSIGFQLGPRMNALGRLDDATIAIELLTTRDAIRAGQLAGKLERLNQERRLLTSQTTAAALEMVERNPHLLDFDALVLAHPAWHAGVVGIVASRLVEEFGKPCVLLLTPPGQPARGSARSAPGVDIGAAIAGCSHLLLTHGGHPGAAGVSLLPENIDRFRRELHRQVHLHRDEAQPTGLFIDVETKLAELNLELVEQVQRLAPFGQGNPTPLFLSRRLTIVNDRRVGRDGSHRRLTVQQGDGGVLPLMWFNGGDAPTPSGAIDLVYTLSVNEYQGERTLQLLFSAIRPAEPETILVESPVSTSLRIRDLRQELVTPQMLPPPPYAAWYAEGARLANADEGQTGVSYAPRTELGLSGGGVLVVWSIPPSAELLEWLVATSDPHEVILCGHNPGNDTLDGVLRGVAGMCRYALQRDGAVDIGRMAARLGVTEMIIRVSLLWLERRGVIRIARWEEGDAVQLNAPTEDEPSDGEDWEMLLTANATGQSLPSADELQTRLMELLAEVRAYRRFYLRASVDELGLKGSLR